MLLDSQISEVSSGRNGNNDNRRKSLKQEKNLNISYKHI